MTTGSDDDDGFDFGFAPTAPTAGRGLATGRRRRDWPAVFTTLRSRLAALWAHPVVRQDPGCLALVERVARSRTIPDMAQAADELAARVAALLARHGASPDEVERLRRPTNSRLRLVFDGAAAGSAPRSRLRL